MKPRFALFALAVVALGIILWSGCSRRAGRDAVQTFQEAQARFDAAEEADDFLRAASLYQKLLDSGVRCGAVYYNQGNALMRAGRRGQAIAAYRQAQRFMPNDPYLEANLCYALGAERSTPPRPLLEYVLFWQNWISYPAKFKLALVLGFLTFGAAAGALFLRYRVLRPIAIGLLAVTCLAGVSALYDWQRFDRTERGVVAEAEVVPRKGNATTYEPAFSQPLAEGTEFVVTGERGSWIRIRLSAGQEAWIERDAAAVY